MGALVAGSSGSAMVDLDSVTTPLVEAFAASLGVEPDLDAPRFAALRDARYACLTAVLADCVAAGADVVAVAPFTREAADGEAWRAWGLALGAASVLTCWLEVDAGTAASRTRRRGLARDVAKSGPGAVRPHGVDLAGVDLVLDASVSDARDLAARVVRRWAGG